MNLLRFCEAGYQVAAQWLIHEILCQQMFWVCMLLTGSNSGTALIEILAWCVSRRLLSAKLWIGLLQ